MNTILAVMVVAILASPIGIKDMVTWEEVVRLSDESTIILILKNPVESEIKFAMLNINKYCIPKYILIGKELHKFEIDNFQEKTYEEVEIEPEEELKIWSFLIKHAGIYSI